MQECLSSPVFLVTNHSIQDWSRASGGPDLSTCVYPARSRRAGPEVPTRKAQSEDEPRHGAAVMGKPGVTS